MALKPADFSRKYRRGMVYWLRTAPGLAAIVYRIERDGARKKGEPWARLRALRNAAWTTLGIPPLSRTPLHRWLEPRWSRDRRAGRGRRPLDGSH